MASAHCSTARVEQNSNLRIEQGNQVHGQHQYWQVVGADTMISEGVWEWDIVVEEFQHCNVYNIAIGVVSA